MKPIAVFDIETDPFKHGRPVKPFLAGWYDGKTVRHWWSTDCVEKTYRSMRNFGGYIFAHSGGKFDFRFLLPHLPKNDVQYMNIKGRIAKITLPNGTEFRDSWLMLPVPLKAGGQKLEIDYERFEADKRGKYRKEITEYFKQDLYALYDMVGQFVAEYGFGLTMAGRTFDQLKKNFDIKPVRCAETYDKIYRRFYYGGRVQFFELGHIKGNLRLIDINSAYPAAMRKRHAFGRDFTITDKIPMLDDNVNPCFIHFIGECSGGLPWRTEANELSFGEHYGEFMVTGWEFAAARRLGRVKVEKVIACHKPTETLDFTRYIDHFFSIKKNAVKGSPEELFAKLFLNSTYGRFALNPREFRDVMVTPYGEEPDENKELWILTEKYARTKNPDASDEEIESITEQYWEGLEGKWEILNDFADVGLTIWGRQAEIKNDSFYNVATAASITGAVRAFLMESLASVTRPVYCDTDSIICEDTGPLKLSPELGDWKLEGIFETDSVWIAGKKLYAARLKPEFRKNGKEWKTAAKGVRLSPQEIIRVAEGEEVKSYLDAPTFSLFTSSDAVANQSFISRTVRRDDKRIRRK